MRRLFPLMLTLLLAGRLLASASLAVLASDESQWLLELDNSSSDSPEQLVSGWIRTAPDASFEWTILEESWQPLAQPSDLALTEGPALAMSPVIRRKGQDCASIAINPVRQTDSGWELLEYIRLSIQADRPAEPGRPAWSRVSQAERRKSVINPAPVDFASRDESNLPHSRYLVVLPESALSYIQPWLGWRESMGCEVTVATREELGGDNIDWQDIKGMAQNLYDTEGLDYILLMGDMQANNPGQWHIPGDAVPGGQYAEQAWGRRIVSDHSLTLLDGDDYFPDVSVGRWPAENATQLATMITRQLYYEQAPLMSGSQYLDKGLMIYDVSGAGSRRETSMAIRQHLLTMNFSQVDTIRNNRYTNPQSPTLVSNAINNGVSYINYRGYGYRNSWNGPLFNSDHALELNNVGEYPFVTSIVCGGGDFGTVFYNPCLAEGFLRAGTVIEPTGAIGMIAPSEEDTHTKWNNAMDLGIYIGLLEEQTRGMGELLTRGKEEIWHCFPNDREEQWLDPGATDQATNVPFYFWCYNLFGDPGTQLRMLEQRELELAMTGAVAGATEIVIQLSADGSAVEGMTVCLHVDGERVALGESSSSGEVVFTVSPLEAGAEIELLAYGRDAVPAELTLEVASEDSYTSLLGLVVDATGDSLISRGELIEIGLQLKEFGLEGSPAGRTIELLCEHEMVTAAPAQLELAAMAFGDEVLLEGFSLLASSSLEANQQIPLLFTLRDTTGEPLWTRRLTLTSVGVTLELAEPAPTNLEPGQGISLDLSLRNTSNFDMTAISHRLYSLSNMAMVVDEPGQGIDLCAGCEDELTTALVTLDENLLHGSLVPLELVFFDAFQNSTIARLPLTLVVGEPGLDDPTGPDSAGYLMIHMDDDHLLAPNFIWNDISSSGEELVVEDAGEFFNEEGIDGSSTVIDLPFPFVFYGDSYNQLTVCSNGWVAPGDQRDNILGLNTPLPAAQGPEGMVAVFWTDLYNFYNNNRFGQLYHEYDESAGTLTLQWSNFHHTGYPWNDNWFQLVLRDTDHYPTATGNTEMLLYYEDIITTLGENFFTVGLEAPDMMRGLEYTFNNQYPVTAQPIQSGTAILITSSNQWEETGLAPAQLAPRDFALSEAWPNPFNPSTQIQLDVPRAGQVSLILYNLRGERLRVLHSGALATGSHSFQLDGGELASGIYLLAAESEFGGRSVKRVALVK